MKKTCIVIMGPTAVGKTALAIQIANHFNTQIISADSRQCFRETDIGVAKPSAHELQSVVHHFINSYSIFDTVNAGVFEKYALEKVKEIFTTHDLAVMVGGTGLYIKSFCQGIDEVPVIAPGIREDIKTNFTLYGLPWLQQQVMLHDPVYFETGEILNPQRLMRALEVKLGTRQSIISFQTQTKAVRGFELIKIGLELPRPLLYERINTRVDEMIKQGLEEEAKKLRAWQHLNALQTVGYREMFDYFKNKTSLPEAIEAIKINTRHYAKRQMTWFKKDEGVHWCEPDYDTVMRQVNLSMA